VSSTILNDIVRDYEAISTAWFSALGPIAQRIFWILAAIQLTWSAIWWVLDREDGLAVVSSLLRQVVAIGFFYALLLNGGTWIPAVIESFSQAGAAAARLSDLSPTGVFDQGLALANMILNATADLGLLDGFFASLIAGITALVVVIAFAVIAAQLLVALVESFIVIGAGVLFLGFAGSRWTKFFTERYLSYVASVGVKLFVLYLIMGVGMGIAARWMPILERGGFSPIPFFYVMGGSLVFVFLTWHIPSVAGSMMAGAVSLSLADAMYPAILGGRVAGTGLVAAGTVGGAAVGAGRWGVDHLRVYTSLHSATAAAQSSNGATDVLRREPEPKSAGGDGNTQTSQASGLPADGRRPGARRTDRETPAVAVEKGDGPKARNDQAPPSQGSSSA
jgi:type IV secretion system protein TrbL